MMSPFKAVADCAGTASGQGATFSGATRPGAKESPCWRSENGALEFVNGLMDMDVDPDMPDVDLSG